MERWLFDIAPNGDVITLYTEEIDLYALGPLQITRASTVEFDTSNQGWRVTLRDGAQLPGVFHSREFALWGEVAYIQEHWDEFAKEPSCAA